MSSTARLVATLSLPFGNSRSLNLVYGTPGLSLSGFSYRDGLDYLSIPAPLTIWTVELLAVGKLIGIPKFLLVDDATVGSYYRTTSGRQGILIVLDRQPVKLTSIQAIGTELSVYALVDDSGADEAPGDWTEPPSPTGRLNVPTNWESTPRPVNYSAGDPPAALGWAVFNPIAGRGISVKSLEFEKA